MFYLNTKSTVDKITIDGSIIYTIDNFYEDADEILSYILKFKPELHKIKDYPSYNSIYFEDRRHIIHSQEVLKVYKFLSGICGQKPLHGYDKILTNFTKFKNNKFNNYEDNYWWPHIDEGYTAIVYLNKDDTSSGTNLYKNINLKEEPPGCPEHYAPWRKKSNFNLLHSISPKYNRMVLFNGFKFIHGMNICNRRYFSDEYRMNQVLFFNRN